MNRKSLQSHLVEHLGETGAQAIGFAVVGLSNTVVSYAIYVISLSIMHALGWLPGYDYIVSQVIAFLLSVLWSYWWNSRLVFGARGWRVLIRTYASYSLTGLFLSSALLILWVQVLGIPEYIAPVLSLLVTVPLNFVLNKFWAFRSKNVESKEVNGGKCQP